VAAADEQYDAVVVGLGAAGCWAVKTLTEAGLRVAALDAGPQLQSSDLPRDLPPAGVLAKVSPLRRWIQSRSVSYHPRLEHLYVDDRRHPYRTRGGDPFLWIRGRQVGGRLHTWARMSLRLGPEDLARGSGPGEPWPIRYEELAPYYDLVEDFHGLRGARDGIASLPDGRIRETVALSAAAELFRARVEARFPARRVIAPRVLEQDIDPVPAPLRAALATGRLRLIADAPVIRLSLHRSGERAVGVEYLDQAAGRSATVRADQVFLCASTIESVRILLNSRGTRHPGGVGGNSGLLGRYLLDHNFVVGAGPTPDEYRQRMPAPGARVSSPLDLGADLDFYLPDFTPSLAERRFERGFGIQGRIFPDQWGMGVFGEMLPDRDNRVSLARRVDALGIPTVNIRVRRRGNDLRMIEAERRELAAIAAAAGLPLRMPFPGWIRGLLWRAVGPRVGVMHLGIAIHEAGGARMGEDRRRSVTDPRNRVWDCPNVWVTDGACLPSTGCQNPTLTIMALTARACALAVGGEPPTPRS
jgi:choline dehydrogenase-like flavoprotein